MDDKSKKIKRIIIILLICILLIILLKMSFTKKENYEDLYGVEVLEGSLEFDLNQVKKVKSRSDYCLVKNCIEKFYNYYINNKDVYSLLDNEYIEKFNVNKNNLEGKFGNFGEVTVDITRNVLFGNWHRNKYLFCLWTFNREGFE